MSTLWRYNSLIRWSMTLKVIQGLIRPPLCQNHSSTFVYRPILMKICMNADTIFSLNYIRPKMHFYVMEKLCDLVTLLPFGLITILTYFLMGNFFPFLKKILYGNNQGYKSTNNELKQHINICKVRYWF